MSTTRHIVKSQGTIVGEVQSLALPHKITKQEDNLIFKATSLVLRTKDLASSSFQIWTQQNGENLYYFKNCIVIGHGSPPLILEGNTQPITT